MIFLPPLSQIEVCTPFKGVEECSVVLNVICRDDSVEDYTVLYYHPVNSGITGIGRLYNKETNRVLEYYYGQIR